MLCNTLEYLIGIVAAGVGPPDQVLLVVVLHNWKCVIRVSLKPLAEALDVVVRAATARLASVEASLHTDLLGAFEKEDELQVDAVRHLAVPAVQVVLVAREAVDQEVTLPARLHCPIQQAARYLHGHNGAIANVVVNDLSELGTRGAFLFS